MVKAYYNFIVTTAILAVLLLTGFALADDAANIIRACGRPDRDDTTAYDKPRPLIVTRIIVYGQAGVRFAFIPEGRAGQAPPYSGWIMIGVVDHNKETVIQLSEALRRIGCR